MNLLIVGADKSDILTHLPKKFLLIDDGPLIDRLAFKREWRVTRLDLSRHHYNPLKDIDYRRTRELISVFDAIFPEGANTLTKKSSNFALLIALKAIIDAAEEGKRRGIRTRARYLDKLIRPLAREKDPGILDAQQKIQTLIASPVLKSFLLKPLNFHLDGIVLARLDRKLLVDKPDAFLIANLLISAYDGPVIIPDFGFYGAPHHAALVRQDRLIAGVNFLDESPLKDTLLLIKDKLGARCIYKDAVTLAQFAGLMPDPAREENPYNAFIAKAVLRLSNSPRVLDP